VTQRSRVEVAKPQVFGEKMTDEVATTQVAWVLLYMQGGVAEA